MRAARLLPLVLGAVLLAAGCGDDEPSPPPQPDPKPEKPEEVSGLPAGWTVERNSAQGFSLGAPPGWRSGAECLKKGGGDVTVTILCSPDRLVTLSISADRTADALELGPEAFAARTMDGLGDSYDGLEAGKPKRFSAHYPGAIVEGSGKAVGTGVPQDVSVVVLRRDHVANFTAVIAANASQPTGPAVALATQALKTLRSEPVGG